jgi:hypothetical protein
MFWATTAHVANDWLAVPLALWLLVACVRYHRMGGLGAAAGLGLVLSLGLLTKAYFLAFVPVVAGVLVWKGVRARFSLPETLCVLLLAASIAAPWYVRNLMLYGALSGTVESVAGIGVREAAAALVEVPWYESIAFMARGSLWTGNNSFTTFSRATLNTMLAVLLAGFSLYAVRLRRVDLLRGDAILLAAVACFCAALVYVTATSFSFRHGSSAGASPWYMQPLLAPLLCLIMRGTQRSGRVGWLVSSILVLLSAYVLCATYIAKLIPLYAGYNRPRSGLAFLYTWYMDEAPDLSDRLQMTCVAPAPLVWVLTCGVLIASVVLVILLWRPMTMSRRRARHYRTF